MKEDKPPDTLADPARLESLAKTGLLDSPPEKAFDRLTELACEVLGVPVSLVSLIDRDRQFFKSSRGLPEPWAGNREIPLSDLFCQRVVDSNQPLLINDAREHPLGRENPVIRDLGVVAYLGIPLLAPDDQVLGSFCAIDGKPRNWSEREARIMFALAQSATSEIALRWRLQEQQAREQALRESEERFVLMADTAPVLIWMSGTDKLRNYFNKPWLEFTGRTMEQEIGDGWAEGVYSEDFQRCLDIHSKAFDAREKFRTECRLRRAGGEYRWVLETGVPRFQDDGGFAGYIGYCVDITERKEVETKQREANDELDRRVQERTKELEEANATLRSEVEERRRVEQKLRLTQFSVDHAVDAIFWVTEDAGISYASDAACRTLGYSPAELTSMSVHDIDPDFPKEVWPEHWKRIKRDGLVTVESRHRTKSGRVFPVEVALNYLEFGGVDYCCAFARDVTVRKRAEEARLKSEGQLRIVTDALPVCISYADSEQRYQFNNKTYEDWFGRSSSELKGLRIKDVIGDSAYETIRKHVETALSGQAVSYESTLSLGGQQRHVLANYVPDIGERGETKGYVALITDITERKQAEEERKKLEAQIQHAQKLESLGVLAGGIAHDFNNLLVGVLGNAELALMDLPPESPAREELQHISTCAQRAADLTKQMLAYSGKGRFAVQVLNLSKLVEEMAHLLEISISKKVALEYNFAADLPSIEADATQVRQVVMNLIINASEAIGERSGVVTVSTGATEADRAYLSETYLDESLPEGDYVYLEVTDTGCGMDEETRKKIFDPFFTTKFTGRGLGLPAVLGIVRGHRGTLKIDSEPNRGTTFRVLFPRSKQQPLGLTRTLETKQAWRGSGTVLVVDDEEYVRTVAARMLKMCGFDVLVALDGREATDLFRHHSAEIVLVLLDLTMPQLDGEETLRELRRIRPDLKAVLSSGYSEQDVTDRFGGKGLARFIQKPYRPGQLIAVVREVLKPAP